MYPSSKPASSANVWTMASTRFGRFSKTALRFRPGSGATWSRCVFARRSKFRSFSPASSLVCWFQPGQLRHGGQWGTICGFAGRPRHGAAATRWSARTIVRAPLTGWVQRVVTCSTPALQTLSLNGESRRRRHSENHLYRTPSSFRPCIKYFSA